MSLQTAFWNVFWLALLAYGAYRGVKWLTHYDKTNQAKLANTPEAPPSIAGKIIEELFKRRKSLEPFHRHFLEETRRSVNTNASSGIDWAKAAALEEEKRRQQPIFVSASVTDSGRRERRHPDGGKTFVD